MITFRYLSRYILLGILALSIAVSQPSIILGQVTSKQTQQQQAELLNQRGQRQLNQGQAAEALQTWQQATKLYQQLKDTEGVIGSLINQSVALQALGSHLRACKILVKAVKFDSEICAVSLDKSADSTKRLLESEIDKLQNPMTVQLLGLQNLGNVLRRLGKLPESELVLKKTLSIGQQLPSFNTSAILLSLSNTEKSIYQQARDRYTLIEESLSNKRTVNFIQKQAHQALNDYQSLIDNLSTPTTIKLQAQLHRLSLLLDFEKWLTAESNLGNTQLAVIKTQMSQQIRPSVEAILKNSSVFSELPASQSVYTCIQFANSLNQISDEQLKLVAIEYAESALQKAKATGEQRLMSNAYGTLGKLEKQKQLKRTYLEKAMSFAQSIQAWDIAYQWQWELGRLYSLSGNFDKANQFYTAAIKNLDKTRSDILLINSDIQFAFKEKVEPLYKEYIGLLFQQEKYNKAYSKQALELQEELNFAEVENFLRCSRFIGASINSKVHHQVKDLPAIVYLIKLADQVQVAVKTPQNIYRHTVDYQLLEEPLNNLFELVQKPEFVDTQNSNALIYSQAVYQLLFEPIKQYLPQSGGLGFVLDSYFQSLPLAMLYDGEQYLIDKYNVAVGSSAKQLQQILSQSSEILVSGVSQVSPSFYNPIVPKNLQPLPQVKVEIENIKKSNPSTSTLLDAEFTSQNFKQINENNPFSVIHLSTHAQFSSDLEQTFVLAWDTPLNVKDLKFLVQKKSNLDLLVLSACQTAKGDRRSFLGIAGMAAQAGARGTLASLWLVDAESTTLLMTKFYDGLKHGLTKAEALRLAQLSLLKSDKYFHPYYWAGFILVGG